MDNLDSKIDTMMRDKLISLIQENASRIGRINVKFTGNNRKDTIDRWQAFYDSYDRMLRSIPKDLIRVEKEVRSKFTSPLTDERITRIKTYINTESQLLFKKLESECGAWYQRLGHGEEFRKRFEKTQAKFQEVFDNALQKAIEALNAETATSGKLSIKDLCALYDIGDSFLHELNLAEPLRAIDQAVRALAGDPPAEKLAREAQSALKDIMHSLDAESTGKAASMEARKARKLQAAKELLALRELIINAQLLLDQASRSQDQRNLELAGKIWERLRDFLEKGREDWARHVPVFKSVYEYIGREGI